MKFYRSWWHITFSLHYLWSGRRLLLCLWIDIHWFHEPFRCWGILTKFFLFCHQAPARQWLGQPCLCFFWPLKVTCFTYLWPRWRFFACLFYYRALCTVVVIIVLRAYKRLWIDEEAVVAMFGCREWWTWDVVAWFTFEYAGHIDHLMMIMNLIGCNRIRINCWVIGWYWVADR